jgi:NAD(P)-dependent dehydrogenase (short-subunit alcohol dehydrogenase family)
MTAATRGVGRASWITGANLTVDGGSPRNVKY